MPSIIADIRDAKAARDRATMTAMFGPPVYGLVDVRDRIGARGKAPGGKARAPPTAPVRPLRTMALGAPSRPKRHRRGEAEVLKASMSKDERETYQQLASEVDKPRKRLRSMSYKDLRA